MFLEIKPHSKDARERQTCRDKGEKRETHTDFPHEQQPDMSKAADKMVV